MFTVVSKRVLHASLKLSPHLASREQKSISAKIIRYLMIYVSIYFLRILAAENIKRLTQMSYKKVVVVP